MQNWKNLVSTLGEETCSRSKFNSIPFYELCLEIPTCRFNEVFLLHMHVECPNFKF